MPADELTISAIVNTYNSGRFVAEALDSVLAQTRQPSEILVMDDGSTDATAQIVAGYGSRVRWFQQPNAGVGAARNNIVRLARGSLLALLDADDIWEPDKLEKQAAALSADPPPDVVFGHVLQVLDPGLDPDLQARLWAPKHPVPGRMASAMLITRQAYDKAGEFPTTPGITEFVVWYGQLVDAGLRMTVLPDVLVRRRIHGANHSMRNHADLAEYPRALKAMLDRRRARQG